MKWPLFRSRDSSLAGGRKHPDILQSQSVRKAPTTIADNPIRSAEADALGRDRSAQVFAVQVLSLDASEGVVVGVLGAWGSGKTSFMNLACTHLESAGIPVVSFNPWMFSGADQLVDAFFVEIAAQLKLRPELADVGDDLDEYGEAFSDLGWLPLLGPWIERGRATAKLVAKILQRRKEGIGGRRIKLWKKLSVLEKPLVVVLDDIDRLTTPEIRDIFKLVRLTANFPNVIYIVAFDRTRVESALAEEGVPGRAYLEKILQVVLDLPAVPNQVLNTQILKAVNDALAEIENTGPFNERAWPDIFTEIIRPVITNMRDVRRYAAAIQGTVRDLEGQVALADVLALESVRVFLPDVFREVHTAFEALTTPSGFDYGDRDGSTRLKEQIDRLIAAGSVHKGVAHALVQRLFPSAERHLGGSHYGSEWKNTWIRARRVAHEDVLRFYLERVIGEGLKAFTDAERAWAYMTDREAFDSFLRSINPGRLEDVIVGLEAYEEEYRPEHVVPGTIVLLNV
jgi:predicted KAP-like P-loop ATPase